MQKTETLDLFYQDKFNQSVNNLSPDRSDFNLFRFGDCLTSATIKYRKRDYFKVTFLTGNNLIHYGDMTLSMSGSNLAFFSPDVPYMVEFLDGTTEGDYFIFKEVYFDEFYRTGVKNLPLFAPNHKPIYSLNSSQNVVVANLFERMKDELQSDYAYKHDLIRSCLMDLVHFAVKLQPIKTLDLRMNANRRIAMVFRELLDRQFPIDAVDQRFDLRSARDYADRLGVHVNHLNRALKAVTGRTTTEHISGRLASEAQVLLKHTQWTVSQIGFSLGFEDTPHFNHFFKKQTHQTPSSFRL